MLAPGVHNATVDDAFPLFSSFTTIVVASDRSQVKSKSAVVTRVTSQVKGISIGLISDKRV
jgi:hypothetical protein